MSDFPKTMSDFPKIEKGDTVRVVIEGEAKYRVNDYLEIGDHAIDIYNPTVKELHVTPKPKPLKVGDVIGDLVPDKGWKKLLDAPVGSILADESGDLLVRVEGGYVNPRFPGRLQVNQWLPRTIVYLPPEK